MFATHTFSRNPPRLLPSISFCIDITAPSIIVSVANEVGSLPATGAALNVTINYASCSEGNAAYYSSSDGANLHKASSLLSLSLSLSVCLSLCLSLSVSLSVSLCLSLSLLCSHLDFAVIASCHAAFKSDDLYCIPATVEEMIDFEDE